MDSIPFFHQKNAELIIRKEDHLWIKTLGVFVLQILFVLGSDSKLSDAIGLSRSLSENKLETHK